MSPPTPTFPSPRARLWCVRRVLLPRISMQPIRICLTAALAAAIMQGLMPQSAEAAEIKVISGGAFKTVLNALVALYQTESGNTVVVTYRTVGQHMKLIASGEEKFDVAVLTPEAIERLAKDG